MAARRRSRSPTLCAAGTPGTAGRAWTGQAHPAAARYCQSEAALSCARRHHTRTRAASLEGAHAGDAKQAELSQWRPHLEGLGEVLPLHMLRALQPHLLLHQTALCGRQPGGRGGAAGAAGGTAAWQSWRRLLNQKAFKGPASRCDCLSRNSGGPVSSPMQPAHARPPHLSARGPNPLPCRARQAAIAPHTPPRAQRTPRDGCAALP